MGKRKAYPIAIITLLAVISLFFLPLISHDLMQSDSSILRSYFIADAQEKQASKGKKAERKFALNFKDVEISEFLNIMSQLIGKNIIMDDKVKGKISISSAKKVPVSQAYDVMKSILEVKGLAVVETGNLIKVLPIQEAIKKNVEIIVDGEKKHISADKENSVTFLLEIKNADATEIANTLKPLKSKMTDIVVYMPLNTIIVSGTSSEIDGLIKIASALDKQAEELPEGATPKGFINVVNLENADAVQLAEVLSRIPFSESAKIDTSPISTNNTQKVKSSSKSRRVTKTEPVSQQQKTKLSIIANKETNSLIITAKPEEFKEINRIIKELDIVREQVLIEALIIEVNAENGWGFGIDWMLGQQSGTNMFGGSSIMGTPPDYSTSSVNGKKLVVPLASGLQLGYLSDTSMLGFVLLNASGTDNNFNILSTPQLLTIDNQEAELNVGEEIPVASNNRISESGTQFYTYEYKSVGIKLKITPHITNSNRITLDLYQEINSVLGTTTDTNSTVPPKLGKRDIKTKVSVLDGKTIVVGGLITNNKSVQETKVPLLGDIPVLGWLFKHKTTEYKKTNLLVFITPHIVTKQDRIDAITKQKRDSQSRLRIR